MSRSIPLLGLAVGVSAAAAGAHRPAGDPGTPPEALGSSATAAGDVVYLAPPASGQLPHENRLMVIPATGGTPRELFSPRCLGIVPHCEYGDPTWSHDGRRLAFAFRGVGPDEVGVWQIRIATADGKVHWVVTEHPGPNTKPTWSPDKKTLAYQQRTRENRADRNWIVTANLCGRLPVGTPTRVTEGTNPSFSQSGDWIAYSYGGDIYKMRPDGSQRTRLTSGAAQDVEPAWTKPGTTLGADQIAFASNRAGNTGYDIYMMKADGSNVRQLTRLAANERNPDLPEAPLFVTHEVEGSRRSIHISTFTSSTVLVPHGWSPALGTSGKVTGGCPPT